MFSDRNCVIVLTKTMQAKFIEFDLETPLQVVLKTILIKRLYRKEFFDVQSENYENLFHDFPL